MGSDLGIADEKLLAVDEYAERPDFTDDERLALGYADAITRSDQDVSDDMFAEVLEAFGEEATIELTAVIAWENASSKFNRALRIASQGLWQRAE